jgi:ABC-type Co2+ transport system permease subunit
VFTLQVPLLNLVVAVGEAILSGFVVEYLGKVRPDLLALREVGGD